MTATYDPNLRITEQGTGDNPNTWGTILNQQVFSLLSNAISGVTQIDFSAGSNIDISTSSLIPPNNYPGVANGANDTARFMVLELTSTLLPLSSGLTLTLPALQKVYFINAQQTGGYPITVMCKGGSQTLTFNAGQQSIIYTNGINIYENNDLRDLLATNNLSDLANAATARTNLGLGTAAVLDVGTSANQIVQLNSSAKLPALDGSLLLNVTGTPAGVGTAAYLNVGTAAGNIPQLNGSAQLPAVDGSQLTNLPSQFTSTSTSVVLGHLTIQAGTGTASVGGGTQNNFSTPFSSIPIIAATLSGGGASDPIVLNSITASGFKAGSTGGTASINWIAIGPT